jgi:hypothetical protein
MIGSVGSRASGRFPSMAKTRRVDGGTTLIAIAIHRLGFFPTFHPLFGDLNPSLVTSTPLW